MTVGTVLLIVLGLLLAAGVRLWPPSPRWGDAPRLLFGLLGLACLGLVVAGWV